MKIAIVTYVKTATCNYGAELQGYALQYKLNSMGFQTEVLDLHRVLPGNSKFINSTVMAIKKRYQNLSFSSATLSTIRLIFSVLKDKYYLKKNRELFEQKREKFHAFFYENIKHSSKEYFPDDLDSVNLDYDTYIAGSDQIWNFKNSDRVDVFFLMFANRFNAKKISYAASCSVSEIPLEYQEAYIKWINNIDFLSVRESAGVNIVKKLTGKKAELVCDPTLLLDKNEWMAQFPMQAKPALKEKFVVIYSMSRSSCVYTVAKKIAHQLGDIQIVNIKTNFTPTFVNGITDLFDVTPPIWLWLICNAEYVVTDSFHGTAFSINFNKQFVTIQKKISDLNSRVETILTKFDLKERIYYDDDSQNIPTANIDYEEINKDIKNWRNASLNFLIQSLKS